MQPDLCRRYSRACRLNGICRTFGRFRHFIEMGAGQLCGVTLAGEHAIPMLTFCQMVPRIIRNGREAGAFDFCRGQIIPIN